MVYLRRVPNATDPKWNVWHPVTEEETLRSVKLGVPKSFWDQIPSWLDSGLVLGNAFALYRKATEEYAEKLQEYRSN